MCSLPTIFSFAYAASLMRVPHVTLSFGVATFSYFTHSFPCTEVHSLFLLHQIDVLFAEIALVHQACQPVVAEDFLSALRLGQCVA